MKPAVLIMSGGLDSTVLLHSLLNEDRDVYGLSFDYGQRHQKELQYAQYWGQRKCKEWHLVPLNFLKVLGAQSALLDPKISMPLEHYTHENQKVTVVPNRNMVMLSIAIAWAEVLNIETVCFAAHKNDYTIYPDCRPAFAYAMNSASQQATYNRVMVQAPFVEMYKSDIVKLGSFLKVPFEQTWSCYQGRELHCGKCATCQERKEAFQMAGVEDPTKYEEEK